MHEAIAKLQPHFEGKSVCVTGGAGFIGSHIVDVLVEFGSDVRVIDNLSNGRLQNLALVENNILFIQESILNNTALRDAMDRCDFVFHEAAMGSVPHSVEEPELFHEVNATGTLRVLDTARRAKVGRVIYAGSSSAYGDSESLPKIETMACLPKSPYAVTKLAGEFHLQSHAACYDMSTVTLRYFNVFGPRQRPDSQYAAVIPAFAHALASGQRPTIFGDGEQSRDFTYIQNVVLANLLAASSERAFRGEVINLACGKRCSLLELLAMMADILNVSAEPIFKPQRPGDVKHSEADIGRAQTLLEYESIVSLREGLEQTLESFALN